MFFGVGRNHGQEDTFSALIAPVCPVKQIREAGFRSVLKAKVTFPYFFLSGFLAPSFLVHFPCPPPFALPLPFACSLPVELEGAVSSSHKNTGEHREPQLSCFLL